MSRIIVKQLPKNISEEKLRTLFGSKGNINDIQLKYAPDGKFRQFAFIGYQNENEAQNAIKYFNGTCIQTNRIVVEPCVSLGDDKLQTWSKYSKDTKSKVKKSTEENGETEKDKKKAGKIPESVSKVDTILGEHKNDPEFLEFLKVHDKNRNLWSNDAEMLTTQSATAATTQSPEKEQLADTKDEEKPDESPANNESDLDEDDSNEKPAVKPISDLEYMQSLMSKSSIEKPSKEKTQPSAKSSLDLFTIKIHNVPYKTKRQDVLKFFKPLKPYSVRLPTNVHGFCYVGFKTEKDMSKAMLKNKSFIKGKQVFFSDFTEKNKITKYSKEGEDVDAANLKKDPKKSKWQQQEDSLLNEESVAESGRIFFRNLSYTVSENELRTLFEKFGPVADINLPVDSTTRQIKGFGTVTYVMPEHAVQAFNKLDGTDFQGRLLHLIPSKARQEDDEEPNEAGLSYKEKKELKLKKSAQSVTNWNTLFLGQNAVAEILSKQFGMKKEKILDTSEGGSNAAVRMALGETRIVIEMKQFLEEHGVRLDAFEGAKVKRSNTTILVKNLPANTTEDELMPIFSKFGPISRLVLPPSGVTALIEFCAASEAKQAFKKIAYSKFKNVPLYLEWAPENTFLTDSNGKIISPKQVAAEQKSVEEEKPQETVENDTATTTEDNGEDESEPPEENTTLFLRNLNFKTREDTIRKHFEKLGRIHTVEVAKRKDPENPRTLNSLGYGFIQFKKSATAEGALKNMQFTTIDGNQVELKRSDRVLKTPETTRRQKTNATKQTGSKMLVRNIPFQAKEKEVRDIFKAFGELRSLRLPLKMTPGESTHRGFGFVDFMSKDEAKKAFDALSQSTHLYGRRLVLEWATTDNEDLGELRKRTAQHFQTNTGGDSKRNKKGVFSIDTTATRADDD